MTDETFDDSCPTSIIAPTLGAFSGEALEVSLESLLSNQVTIAGELQRIITSSGGQMDTKDLRDLVSTLSALVNSIHKANEPLKALSTYRLFTDVVIEFIRRRSDTLGDDLVAELHQVARELRATAAAKELLK